MEWKIGNKTIVNQVVLAPMAGVSNPAYMKICAEMGVGYAITELISAEAIVRDNQKTFDMLNGIESVTIPVAVQLFGAHPETLAQAAKIITKLYPNVLIDLNMGCPVPKVAVRAQAGSGLLRDPDKVKAIVEAVVKAVSVPVTVKIRSGWDKDHINAVTIAKICEEAGAQALAIHGRTRAQGYQGTVDLAIIKQVKEAVSIPVIGNGDIRTCYDAKQMMEITGCDAVMIGRAVMGNPWLIRDCVAYLETGSIPKSVSAFDRIDMLFKHLDYLLETRPEKVAILEMRSHAAWYLKGLPRNGEVRQQIMQITSKEALQACLEQYRKEVEHEG